jgi:hypothetical protein
LADQTVPTVSLTAPTAGAFIRGTTNVNATAADNVGVTQVVFKDGATTIGTDTTSPYSLAWNTTGVANGAHSLTAVASDAAGNATTSAAVSVTVDNAAPAATMTAPANGASVSGTTVTVSATASDNIGVVGVQFKLDGTNLSAEDTTSPYSIVWNSTTVPDGSHALTAVSRDAAGNTTTSTAVTVTVNNAPPPTASLSSNKPWLYIGNSATLTWSSTNATSCTASGAWSGTLATSGTQIVSPAATSTYNLSCTGTGGTANASAAITVYTAGDANHDSHVDILDLSTLLTNYGTTNTACDFNASGTVDVFDLSALLTHFGI